MAGLKNKCQYQILGILKIVNIFDNLKEKYDL